MGSPRSTRRPAFNGRRLGMLAAAVVMCCWLSGLRREAASAKRQATTAAVGGAGGGPEQLAAQSLADAKPAAAASLRTATKKASLALDGAAAAREALAAAAAAAAEAAIAIEQRKSRTQGQPAARVVEDAEVVAGQVLAGAGVHGFVEKTGSLDPQAWQTVHKRWRAKRLHAWESQRGAALAAGEASWDCACLLACPCLLCSRRWGASLCSRPCPPRPCAPPPTRTQQARRRRRCPSPPRAKCG